MTIKKLILPAVLALGLPFTLGHAALAQNIVSVNFTGSPSSTDGDPSFLAFDQTAGVVPAANFNNGDGFMSGTISNVTDDTGASVSGLSVAYHAPTEGMNGVTAPTPNEDLLNGFIAGTNGMAATATVTGLPASFGTYSLYVYLADSAAGAAAGPATYTFQSGLLDMNGLFVGDPLGTTTQTAQVATAPSDTFTQAAATTSGNYLLFSGLTASTFQLSADSAAGMAPINGFQIVGGAAAPVPESSTVVSTGLLLALGGALVLARRRKTSAAR